MLGQSCRYCTDFLGKEPRVKCQHCHYSYCMTCWVKCENNCITCQHPIANTVFCPQTKQMVKFSEIKEIVAECQLRRHIQDLKDEEAQIDKELAIYDKMESELHNGTLEDFFSKLEQGHFN